MPISLVIRLSTFSLYVHMVEWIISNITRPSLCFEIHLVIWDSYTMGLHHSRHLIWASTKNRTPFFRVQTEYITIYALEAVKLEWGFVSLLSSPTNV